MKELAQTKVGAVVNRDYRTARIFSTFGIDFCCKGGITVAEACKNLQLSEEEVLVKLGDQLRQEEYIDPDAELKVLPFSELSVYIVRQHHAYIRETAPIVEGYLLKIANVHGARHPELVPIFTTFRSMHQALLSHLEKEERILFPRLIALEAAMSTAELVHAAGVLAPILAMENEHSVEGERLRGLRRLSNNYTAPADGCQTYQVAFRMLAEFEADLHRHIHLENNVLFDRARALVQDALD
jgi:regulator of cell morphogenesis and NO signaling